MNALDYAERLDELLHERLPELRDQFAMAVMPRLQVLKAARADQENDELLADVVDEAYRVADQMLGRRKR